MQNFSPENTNARLARLEAALFGVDVPDYVVPPSETDKFPPINQEQMKNPDGSGAVDQYNRPVMRDKIIHRPGLLDQFGALHSKMHGSEPAGEGAAANPEKVLQHGKNK